MNPLSHLCHPSLLFILLSKIFHFSYSFFDLLVLMFFSVFPDLDTLLFALTRNKEQRISFLNLIGLIVNTVLPDSVPLTSRLIKKEDYDRPAGHRHWFTHQPLFYSPLILLLFFYPQRTLILASFGIYSHFLLDMFFGGRIMWLYPFSRRTSGIGKYDFTKFSTFEYFSLYKRTILYKLEIIAFFALLIVLIFSLR